MEGKGTVYLVGAGPGDLGLLTLRAKELIESCDVLIYDNLVNESVITLCDENSEKIYVGKSGARHTMEQDDINRLIADKAEASDTVVRLKGGDPFIFGRGGEEALYLAERGIPFEVINGISSAYAVPAYAGIPVTNRGYSSSVAFITGHEDPTKAGSDIHWDKLATGVQTLVFLMGVKNLPLIMGKLMENGLAEDTPVAVIENGCQPIQRTVTGTLTTITERITEAGIRPPSIIVVGRVVSLREQVNWYESKPLFGKSIVVTRSRAQASRLVTRLSNNGARVIEMPSIKIIPSEDLKPIEQALDEIDRYDWIIFTSVNGVDHFFHHLHRRDLDSRSLRSARVCAIGTTTAEQLAKQGIRADMVPEKFVSTEISRELKSAGEIEGRSFLLPRADIAPASLADALVKEGASRVDDVTIYRTVEQDFNPGELKSLLGDGTIDMVTFTSSSTARNFKKILEKTGFTNVESLKCAAIGPVTAETAKELGFSVEVVAPTHTIDGLVESLLQYFS